MPSVLAICDLRRRIRRRLMGRRIGENEFVALLSIDPPAVLRGLRDASAPIYGRRDQRWTVPLLVKTLGPAVSRRLSLAAERGMSGTASIRRLWMHAVATACAARDLAEQSEIVTPD